MKKQNYTIFNENGKYGLRGDRGVVILKPVYTALQITNEDIDLHDLLANEPGDNDFDDQGVGLHNCQIILADGKQGLVTPSSRLLGVKFDRIIKLTYRHYLGKKGTSYTLYDHIGFSVFVDPAEWHTLQSRAEFEIQGELTLEKFLAVMSRTDPDIFTELSHSLYKNPHGENFISDFLYYYRENYSHDNMYSVAAQRVNMYDDFRVTHLDVLRYHYFKASLF
jgi:hypothetical protein